MICTDEWRKKGVHNALIISTKKNRTMQLYFITLYRIYIFLNLNLYFPIYNILYGKFIVNITHTKIIVFYIESIKYEIYKVDRAIQRTQSEYNVFWQNRFPKPML